MIFIRNATLAIQKLLQNECEGQKPKQNMKSYLNLDYLLKVIDMKTKLQVILYKYVRVNEFLNRAYIVHQAMEKDILLKIKNFF